jgi:hypothetical protein
VIPALRRSIICNTVNPAVSPMIASRLMAESSNSVFSTTQHLLAVEQGLQGFRPLYVIYVTGVQDPSSGTGVPSVDW